MTVLAQSAARVAVEIEPRLRVLMICAHEPTLDPRVRWEAESAAQHFDTTVLGFNRDDGSKPAVQQVDGYRIVRLQRRDFGVVQYFWRLKDTLSPPQRVALAVTLLLIFLGDIALQVLQFVHALAVGLAGAVARRVKLLRSSAAASETPRSSTRSRPFARLLFIQAVMRVQFAPAAVLFWNYLVAMPQRPRVIHCNDLDTLLVGVLAKQRFGCRLIYDAHEFYPVSDPSGIWIDVKFFTWLERVLINHADAVVTVNPMLAELMRAAYGLKVVHAVPNVEPWVENRPKTARVNPASALAKGRVTFLFQGRFTPERGIDEMIEAWAELGDDKAILCLRGPDNIWRQATIDLARRLGVLGKSVFFLDAVTEDQLVEAAGDADVGIVPYKPLVINDRLSCPNKLSQYLHAGLMVVCNDLPYVRNVIEEAAAGLSYSAMHPTLADVVNKIVDDPELLRRCRANARAYARDTFNWQAQGGVFHRLYAAAVPLGHTNSAMSEQPRHTMTPH